MAKLEKSFTADSLGKCDHRPTAAAMATGSSTNYANQNIKTLLKDNRWTLPDNALELAMKIGGIDKRWLKDGFGEPFRLVKKAARTRRKASTSSTITMSSRPARAGIGRQGQHHLAECQLDGIASAGWQAA